MACRLFLSSSAPGRLKKMLKRDTPRPSHHDVGARSGRPAVCMLAQHGSRQASHFSASQVLHREMADMEHVYGWHVH